jgi:hypothetical protein
MITRTLTGVGEERRLGEDKNRLAGYINKATVDISILFFF